MRKTIQIILFLLLTGIVLLSLSACKDTFRCEHCHQIKTDTPHHITVNAADTTVCSECFESYQNGEWAFPS